MPLVRAGRNLIASMLVGTHSTNGYYNSTGAILWVGSGTADHSPTQTHLQGNPKYSTQPAGFPSIATNILQFRGVWSTADANHSWDEWGLTNATSTGGGTLLQRMQEALGVKTSAQSWELTACCTITT